MSTLFKDVLDSSPAVAVAKDWVDVVRVLAKLVDLDSLSLEVKDVLW